MKYRNQLCLLVTLTWSAGCSASSPAYSEAEGLRSQGKLEEAAAKYELVCGQAPLSQSCIDAEKKAAETRLTLATQDMGNGKFLLAEKQAQLALIRTDDASRIRAKDLLESEEMKQGLAYERASLYLPTEKALLEVEKVAATSTKAAAAAKKWLEGNRPTMLLSEAKAACGPAHRGSCFKAWRELEASGAKSPEVDQVRSLAEAEQKRVKPLRSQAEQFLGVFGEIRKKREAFVKCRRDSGDALVCRKDTYGDGDDMDSALKSRFLSWQNNETLFRRLLKKIGDEAIVEDLRSRKKALEETGELPRTGLKP